MSLGIIHALPAPGVRPELVGAVKAGLADGSLWQSGGVIRRAFPRAVRGQIFAHLRQGADAPLRHVVNWGPQVGKASQLAAGFAAATTALSVVNLGVSVAGFAILAKKMNRLQASMSALDAAVQSGFQAVEGRLDRIEVQLAGLTSLVAHGHAHLDTRLTELQAQVDWSVTHRVQVACEGLADLERGRSAGSDAAGYAEMLRSVRVYSGGVLAASPWVRSESWDAQTLRLRSLAMMHLQAVSGEARAWRMAGETSTAARVLNESVAAFRPLAKDWAQWSLGGDASVLGVVPLGLGATGPEIGVSRLLTMDPLAGVDDLDADFGGQWAERLVREPVQARAWNRDPAPVRRAVRTSRELMGPLAEALEVLGGLEAEYRHLEERGQTWEAWESGSDAPASQTLLVHDAA